MFITIEGIDGCGKSTQSARLARWLEERTGHATIRTFEPGGSPDGGKLREFLLNSRGLSPTAELLLFLADRAEHVDKVIAPALSAGHNVICERWNESTLAYQSGGHDTDISRARALIASCAFPEPDVKLFLDVEPDVAMSRVRSREHGDKFEDEGLSLMLRVAEFYRTLASKGELLRIDCGSLDEDGVFSAIKGAYAWPSR